MTRYRWAAVVVSVIGLALTGLGIWCPSSSPPSPEHEQRVAAEVALSRAETELEVQTILTQAAEQTCTEQRKMSRNAQRALPEVPDGPDYSDLADAINLALGIR